ncbi:MAG: hypothetical protein WCH40_13305, partial [Verrucomicrobiales bacterium]
MSEILVTIAGTGSYLPERILTNAELSEMVDTTDEWIFSRTGIRERRIAAEGEFTSHLATNAARKALEQAEMAAEDIELIIVATITPDTLTPATACYVQRNLGAHRAVAFDISAACSGFLYAMKIAQAGPAVIADPEIIARSPGYSTAVRASMAVTPASTRIGLAVYLARATHGWTPDHRKQFFGYLDELGQAEGGHSLKSFVRNIRKEALAEAPEAERAELEKIAPTTARKPTAPI